jgi:DNA-binding beta-propeller fold protein YncE
MRHWRWLALCLGVAGCGDSAKPPGVTCSASCPSPRWTTLDLIAGQPGGPGWVDGTLAAAHFADPWTFARDDQGHLYVADAETIRVVDIGAGTVATLAGVYRQIGAVDGPGAQAMFNKPSGLAFADGQLYVVDTENDTLRKIDVQSGVVTTIAGSPGLVGAVDAAGADARFSAPEGLARDRNGSLYIGDTENNTIRKLDVQTGMVTTLAGSVGVRGNVDGMGTAAVLNRPKALAIDGAGNLSFIDSRNQSLRKVDLATGAVTTLTTFDALPLGIAIDGSDVLVSLTDQRIARVGNDGAVTPIAGGMGVKGLVDGIGGDARFDTPAGLLNDGAGMLYVADEGNQVLRAVALASGAVRTLAGAKSVGSADGTAMAARFSAPQGLAADDKTAYVADTGNHVIRAIALARGTVTTLAGATGQADRTDGTRSNARFNQPQGLALDAAAGQLYVADTNNRSIRRIDLRAGAVSTLAYTAAPGDSFAGLDKPSGLALAQGRLFVSDYTEHAVFAIDLKNARISTLAGTYGVPGRADGAGTAAAFYGPLGIAADAHGNLFVADDLNQTVRKIEIATAAVSTLAGQPVIVGSSDGSGVDALFHDPFGVAAYGAGDLFVSDFLNNTVRHIDVATGTVTTVVGTLVASGVRLGALPAQLAHPSALGLTPAGNLLIVSENSILLAH